MMKAILSMKTIKAAFTSVILLISSSGSLQTVQEEPLTYQVFYDSLSPYGTWIDYPGYGQVWNPDIKGDFRPYLTNGYWVATTAGWTWASNYRWGWAPFHYGRWLYDDRFGWLWIPGYEWSPAWVAWGTADEYYCWTPLMPDVNVTVIFDTWSPALFYWNLCPRKYIRRTRLQPLVIRGDRSRSGIRITHIRNYEMTPRTRSYYAKGPAFEEVQRETGSKINTVRLEDVGRAPNRVSPNRARVYRPTIETPEIQQQRASKPRPDMYRNSNESRNPQNQEPVNTQRSVQRANINSLPLKRK